MTLEPLKFKPILKQKIWGGNKLNKLLQKDSSSSQLGESWEISDVEKNTSIVSQGVFKGLSLTELIQKYKGELVGEKVYQSFQNKFPLLIKYIDAKENLSIQLHPNDELAKKRHGCFGKTEMWYVMQADKEAELIVGFKDEVTKETYQKHLKENTIKSILNVDKVKEGDVYFIPTGRVHAIGAGVMLAEIQQTSDITYRIYDWNRKDSNGNTRELHTKNALDALDFEVRDNYKTFYKKELNKSSLVVGCPYFTTTILPLDKEVKINHSKKDSFVIYLCVKGNVTFALNNKEYYLNYGETILLPNSLNEIKIKPSDKAELLEVYI